MNQLVIHRKVGLLALLVFVVLSVPASAGTTGKGILGDWQVTMDFDGRQLEAILSLSMDKEDNLSGQWISFGISELTDIKYEGSQLSFVQVNRFGDNEFRSTFTGTIERGKLSGTVSSNRGESHVEGKRLRRMPIAAGTWQVKFNVGDRQVSAALVIKADDNNNLSAEWQSERGQHEITDVTFKKNKLTFKRTSKVQDQQWESSFEGTVKGHKLTGTIKSERGDIALEGQRVGGALVGKWDLELTSDRGTRKQLLQINPDLSGLYGSSPIKKINLEGNQMSFKMVRTFGDQESEITFKGTLDGKKLTGERISSRGTQTVTGQKRSSTTAKQKTTKIKEASRKPDVIYVPTPQEVVDKMLELAQVKKDDIVYDLGCGDGRIVITAAKKYGCKCVGYDIDPKRIKESLESVEKNNVGDLVRIEQEDIFTLDLSKANVITLYLLPSLNVKLIPQLEKLKPGSRIVSHDFDMRGVTPNKVVKINSDNEYNDHTIYLWTTPLKKEDVSDE
ncbi:MAG: methyltransferase domain-containing protein [Sedimentisphaerales bacterium]|nr:methyltransferase domain-containing protein [Sedimentisphaerales bacterium]